MGKAWINLIVKRLWPWFLKHVWPHIRQFILELIGTILLALVESIKAWYNRRSQQRERNATRRGREAKRSAGQASDASEQLRQEAIAGVWRDVAEEFRQDNEELTAKLDELLAKANADAVRRLSESEPSIHAHKGSVRLLIAGGGVDLPLDPANPIAPLSSTEDLLRSHDQLRAVVGLACKRIRNLNPGRHDDPVLAKLRVTLQESRKAAIQFRASVKSA